MYNTWILYCILSAEGYNKYKSGEKVVFSKSLTSNYFLNFSHFNQGFETTFISKGSGIDNIKNRASESGWNVAWEKVVPSGTRVVIANK